MKRSFALIVVLLGYAITATFALAQDAPTKKEKAVSVRPLKISDTTIWERTGAFVLSPNGEWKGMTNMPAEGDGTLTIAKLNPTANKTDKKDATPGSHKFKAGPGSGRIVFSHDSKFVAFMEAPLFKEAKAARKAKKPLKSKAVLIELETGKKTEFDNAQDFSFSGENSTCFVVKKPRPKGRPSGDDGWSGTDLLITSLADNKQINIGNVKSYRFNKSGSHLAMLMDAEGKSGNGLQFLLTDSLQIRPMENDKAEYKSLSWTKEGDALSLLKATKDKSFENPRHVLIGYSDVGSPNMKRVQIDATEIASIPEDKTISSNKSPTWTTDRSAILFGIHDLKKKEDKKPAPEGEAKKPKKDETDDAGVVVWHWKDKRMQSMQQKQESRDKNRFDLCVHHVKTNETFRLADQEIPTVTASKPYKYAVGVDNSAYELMGNISGRRYSDIYTIELKTGKRKLAIEKLRFFFGASPNGTHLLYYVDGHFFAYDMAAGTSKNLTENIDVSFVNVEDDHNVIKPPRRPVGWSNDGNHTLLSDGFDIWKVSVIDGASENMTLDGTSKQIRYSSPAIFDRDQDGVDFSKPVYVRAYGEWTKKAGFGRINPGKTGVEMLMWDDASFQRLSKLKDHEIYTYSRQTQQQSPNYYVGGPDLKDAKQQTDTNSQQKNFKWSSGVKLIDYTNDNGDKLQGALYLPAGYIEGKKYPTIVYMYEKLSQRANNYSAPRTGGFSQSIYTSNGYAVFNPDIVFRINDPGMSSKDCILSGLAAAVESGVVDPDNVGIHGHSWGGYQTAFMVTQTDKFKAAVAGAALTNMISMYSSIYWNSGSANSPIFESSQGRFEGGYWKNIEAYARNSPVYHATNVTTPLVILHNDMDGAVDWNQGIEYFNTLRNLEKPVVMLQYKGENHGLRIEANRKDYSYRMLAFFDHYLKGKDAPKWWSEGIKHLDMKKHVKEYKKANSSE